MEYHSITTVRMSVTIVVSEGLEVQVGRKRPRTRHDLEDDSECDQIDNYKKTGPVAQRDVE